ncbi:MAG TPA: hypothetical protein VJ779_07210 [Acetobacteraceae bacterium]|nr:hypothetical protein [Acetobacteraceae bacterium]
MRGITTVCAILMVIGSGTALAWRNPLQCGWHSSYFDYVEAQRALRSGHGIATPEAARRRMEEVGFSEITGLYQDGVGVWHAFGAKQGLRQAVALNPNGNMAVGYRNIFMDCHG